jgi:predicted O-linked N-acetylglucosamine transferase (SPINDLY family)
MTHVELVVIRDRAQMLHAEGRLAEALEAHAQALELAPDAVGVWLSAAQLAHEMNLQEISLPHYEQAATLDPGCLAAIDAARRIAVGVGLRERAARWSERAFELAPSAETLISQTLLVPSIAASHADIAETRRRYSQALDALFAAPGELDKPSGALGISAFFLAYHGENDRALQEKSARAFLRLIPSLAMTAPHCRAGRRREGKIRIGFVSRFFHAHSIQATSLGLIEKLSRERFEVHVLRITPSPDDAATATIRAAADFSHDLDPDIYMAREQIADLELDILFYQDIGMEQSSYFLAFARLAPVQCVSFGHPNTTGIPTIDYFISNDLYEPADATAHYSERLFLLRDLPTLAYYYAPVVPSEKASPESFGLPPDATLYCCPQTLYKLHPDFDAILAGILARDPRAVLVFIAGQFAEFTTQLRARFASSMPGMDGRIVFLPRLPFDRFMQLLGAVDVILDTPHFNGMNTSLQAFAVGTPVVTLPTGLQRGRHTQAMYRKMQITDCIAHSAAEYVDIAVRLGTDPTHARALRERILSSNGVLYEDPRVIAEFERFFTTALRERTQPPPPPNFNYSVSFGIDGQRS